MRDFRLLSVIISVYNEESTIAGIIERVAAVETPFPKEIIVVDDGSDDRTGEILRIISLAFIKRRLISAKARLSESV